MSAMKCVLFSSILQRNIFVFMEYTYNSFFQKPLSDAVAIFIYLFLSAVIILTNYLLQNNQVLMNVRYLIIFKAKFVSFKSNKLKLHLKCTTDNTHFFNSLLSQKCSKSLWTKFWFFICLCASAGHGNRNFISQL